MKFGRRGGKVSTVITVLLLVIIFVIGLNVGRRVAKGPSGGKSHTHFLEPTRESSIIGIPERQVVTNGVATRHVSSIVVVGEQRGFVQPLLPKRVLELLNRKDNMLDLSLPFEPTCAVPPSESDSSSNYEFLEVFGRLFREKFDNLPWWLDEGGLIGSSRAGSMRNADDDFDFFTILPNQHAPCRNNSLTCSLDEYEAYIHKFLMVFWNAGMCINKFHPSKQRFRSRGRLMYSFQLRRSPDVDPERCFHEGMPFAHMHLGIFNDEGVLQTNIWAKHTTHPIDSIPLDVVLPVRRCRVGRMDGPCPNRVTEYLTIRNRGEYRKKSNDGSCLLVKQRWGLKRKREQVAKTVKLRDCGYNGLFELIEPFVSSNYTAC